MVIPPVGFSSGWQLRTSLAKYGRCSIKWHAEIRESSWEKVLNCILPVNTCSNRNAQPQSLVWRMYSMNIIQPLRDGHCFSSPVV